MDTLKTHGRCKLEAYRLSPLHRFIFKLLRLGSHDWAANYLRCFGSALFDTGFIHNVTTNTGKAAMAGLVGNTGAVSAFTYLGVGTSSTAVAATDTALTAEVSTSGLGRTAATISRVTTSVTNDTLQAVVTWTASGSVTVQEVGLFNAASTGVMVGHLLTGSKSVVSGDLLIGTYQIQFS